MGRADWSSIFCSNIQVQNGAVISLRYKAITRRLNTDFWETASDTSHSLQVGSYGRNTAVHLARRAVSCQSDVLGSHSGTVKPVARKL